MLTNNTQMSNIQYRRSDSTDSSMIQHIQEATDNVFQSQGDQLILIPGSTLEVPSVSPDFLTNQPQQIMNLMNATTEPYIQSSETLLYLRNDSEAISVGCRRGGLSRRNANTNGLTARPNSIISDSPNQLAGRSSGAFADIERHEYCEIVGSTRRNIAFAGSQREALDNPHEQHLRDGAPIVSVLSHSRQLLSRNRISRDTTDFYQNVENSEDGGSPKADYSYISMPPNSEESSVQSPSCNGCIMLWMGAFLSLVVILVVTALAHGLLFFVVKDKSQPTSTHLRVSLFG